MRFGSSPSPDLLRHPHLHVPLARRAHPARGDGTSPLSVLTFPALLLPPLCALLPLVLVLLHPVIAWVLALGAAFQFLVRDVSHVVLRLELLVVPILLHLVIAWVLALGAAFQFLIRDVSHVVLRLELLVVPILLHLVIAWVLALGAAFQFLIRDVGHELASL